MRIITYNIKDGAEGREQAVLDVLTAAQADLIFLQEVTRPERVRDWAGHLQMECVVAGGRSSRRVALLSRHPVVSWRSHTLFSGMSRDWLSATVEYHPQQMLDVLVVHLTAQPLFVFEWLRVLELGQVLRFAARNPSDLHLLAGDFNSVGPTDRPITDSMPRHVMLMHWLQGRRFLRSVISMAQAADFLDCFRALNSEPGYTLPPPVPTIRFDYVFANPPLAAFLKDCFIVRHPDAVERASDHYPLCAEFELEQPSVAKK